MPTYQGVVPVNRLTFTLDNKVVKECENLEISVENGMEEWNAIGEGGWTKRLLTEKSLKVKLSGKRCYGDTGNDYVASFAYKSGLEAEGELVIGFPDGGSLTLTGVINVTAMGGKATEADKLEWEVLSSGEPVYSGGNE
ncbi:MAG: hypothetical protein IJS61_00675 [Firmicutes bacterium]|nr:hypothetical protein [Bacillota bacterium]